MAKDKKTKENGADDNGNSKKKTAFEKLGEMYRDVSRYSDLSDNFINQDGTVRQDVPTPDLERVVLEEMNKVELKDEHRRPHIELMRAGGASEVFGRFVGLGQKKALDKFDSYAKANLKDIIYSTDDEILRGVFLSEAVKKKTGVPEYDELGNLVRDINERIENLKKYEKNPEGAKKIASKVADELKADYKKSYNDEALLEVLNAMANGVAMIKYQIDTRDKQKELTEKLEGNLKDYVYKALGEDAIGIYRQLYETIRQRTKQGNTKRD